MGRKARRAIYDPSIMDRVDPRLNGANDISPLDPDPLAFHDEHPDLPYETQETEILDPKLHRQYQGAKKSGKGRCYCLAALVAAGVIAIIVTASVLVSKNNHASSSSTSTSPPPSGDGGFGSGSGTGGDGSGGGGSSGGGTANKPPDMPPDLSSICLDGFGIYFNGTETGKGRNDALIKDCQIKCQMGECCNFPDNFAGSCITGNEDMCANYHQACHVLSIPEEDIGDGVASSTTIVDAASPSLTDACSLNSIMTPAGARNCTKLCRPGRCCYDDTVNNCQASNPSNCPGYASCNNLEIRGTVNQQMTDQVVVLCDREKLFGREGRMKCRDACKLGKCCFVGNDRCSSISADPAFCNVQYRPCSVLYDGSLPDLPPSDGNYGSDGDGNGANDDFLDDDNYLYDDDDPRDHGAGNGTDDYYDDDFVDDAVTDVDKDENGHPLLPNSTGLADDCNPTAVNTNATAANVCLRRCKQAQCCLFEASLPQSCLAGNNAKCLEYQRWCGVLFGDQDQTPTEVDKAPANVTTLCAPPNLVTAEGRAQCQEVCSPGECCFSWESSTQCVTDTDCGSFAPCLNLQSMSQNNPSIEDSVDQACNANSVANYDGYQACQQICMSHVCCWAADQSFCTADVNVTCPAYDSCKYLRIGANFSDQPTDTFYNLLADPPGNLTAICTDAKEGDANAVSECKSYCNKAACCDLPENLEGSCLKGNHLTCLRYHRGCAALQHGDSDTTSGVTVTEAPPDLVAWCSVESLGTTYGRSQCQNECSTFPCCWTDATEGSCHTQDNCDTYSPCYNLRAANSTSETIVNEVNDKCDAGSLSTPEGLAVCQQICLQHTCCWDVYDDQVVPCFGNATCAQYTACSAALQDSVTDDYVYPDGDGEGLVPGGGGGRNRQVRGRLRE